jgi:hypothetical protein
VRSGGRSKIIIGGEQGELRRINPNVSCGAFAEMGERATTGITTDRDGRTVARAGA